MGGEKSHIILIIDDDKIFVDLCINLLGDKYIVFPALSGDQAFETLDKITPDLILLDIYMLGMNGYEIMDLIRQNPKTKYIPVIFVTGSDDIENEYVALKMGANDYILKPFLPGIFLQRIENLLRITSPKKKEE